MSDGQTVWVRATRKQNNGGGGNTTTFYTSPNGVTWSQLGNQVFLSGTAAIFDNTAPLQLGAWVGSENLNGKLYVAQVLAGIDGTKVADFEAPGVDVSTPSPYTDPTGSVWTLHGSGWSVDTTPSRDGVHV